MPDIYLPPWLRDKPDLAQAYVDAWIETGDTTQALEAIREHPNYDTYFPGNRRPDGTVFYDEAPYQSITESFDDALIGYNLNPELFRGKYGQLISGLVSPEEFASRLDRTWAGLIDQAPAVRQWYVERGFAEDITDEAIFASMLDPDLDAQIAAGQINMAQVGGAAAERGFSISREFASRLNQAGLDTSSEASSFFALAEGAIPVLQVLARRHNDPNDEFDLESFTQAQLLEDPTQRRHMRRLIAQERAGFTEGAAGVGSVTRGPTGGLSGLQRL